MSLTHDELRALAMVATPGPWILETDSCDCGGDYPCIHGTYPYEIYAPARQVDHYGLIRSARLANFPEAGNATMADAKFIAAANPATVISLLDEVTRLRAAATSSADALYRYHLIGMINGHDYGLCVEEDECRICTTIRTLRAAIEEAPQ